MAVSAIDAATAPITTADGVPLKVSLARTERRRTVTAFLLVTPLLVFIVITFIFPIGQMLLRSVQNPVVADLLPRTLASPSKNGIRRAAKCRPRRCSQAAAEEFATPPRAEIDRKRSPGRINYNLSGAKSMIKKTARKLAGGAGGRCHRPRGLRQYRQALGRGADLGDHQAGGQRIPRPPTTRTRSIGRTTWWAT